MTRHSRKGCTTDQGAEATTGQNAIASFELKREKPRTPKRVDSMIEEDLPNTFRRRASSLRERLKAKLKPGRESFSGCGSDTEYDSDISVSSTSTTGTTTTGPPMKREDFEISSGQRGTLPTGKDYGKILASFEKDLAEVVTSISTYQQYMRRGPRNRGNSVGNGNANRMDNHSTSRNVQALDRTIEALLALNRIDIDDFRAKKMTYGEKLGRTFERLPQKPGKLFGLPRRTKDRKHLEREKMLVTRKLDFLERRIRDRFATIERNRKTEDGSGRFRF